MSGVYIEMPMPKNCISCRFLDYHRGYRCMINQHLIKCLRSEERQDDCPLIPVPDHGRLIDADALEKEAQKRMLICSKDDNQFQKPYEIMRAIALAPTIIQASESGDVK